MPEALGTALATPGLGWMALAILTAGLVRGFTGFGTALIFVPVAGQFLPGPDVIAIMALTGMFSTVALVPGAWKLADRGEVGALAFAAAVCVPVGLWVLSVLDPLTLRWIVSGVVAATLAAVITGWRWHGRLGGAGRVAIGGGAGLLGGMTGLTGPVVIIFYLANARSARSVRANTILFLAALDVVLIVTLMVSGQAGAGTLWIALALGVPYLLATVIGQAVFDPLYEKAYRIVAYGVIGLALVSGLPILD